MLGRRSRQIRTLQGRIDKLVAQRDTAVRERDAAVRLNGRLAAKVGDATKTANQASRAWCRVVKDANLAESLFSRAMSARRAESRRLHRTITELRRTQRDERKRFLALQDRAETLQLANEALCRDLLAKSSTTWAADLQAAS
jgi:hypothetical protein